MKASLATARPATYTAAQWRDAIEGSASEIARLQLGFTGAKVTEAQSPRVLAGMVGAHIPMVGAPSYELSVVATRQSCEALATAVLGMSVEGMPASVVADAIGEIVNMLAGGVKRRLGATDHELGLPVFVNGSVEPTDRHSLFVFPMLLGAIEAVVAIVGPR
jgi:CheY-specific phosphatase CheX